MSHFISFAVAMISLCLVSTSCQESGTGVDRFFDLPEGDIEQGEVAFVALQCNHCHTVAGVDLPKPELSAEVSYQLGGQVRRVKSYGELATSIICPQHLIVLQLFAALRNFPNEKPVSPMPFVNERMMVCHLIGIVAFLKVNYQKTPPSGTTYPCCFP